MNIKGFFILLLASISIVSIGTAQEISKETSVVDSFSKRSADLFNEEENFDNFLSKDDLKKSKPEIIVYPFSPLDALLFLGGFVSMPICAGLFFYSVNTNYDKKGVRQDVKLGDLLWGRYYGNGAIVGLIASMIGIRNQNLRVFAGIMNIEVFITIVASLIGHCLGGMDNSSSRIAQRGPI